MLCSVNGLSHNTLTVVIQVRILAEQLTNDLQMNLIKLFFRMFFGISTIIGIIFTFIFVIILIIALVISLLIVISIMWIFETIIYLNDWSQNIVNDQYKETKFICNYIKSLFE